MMQLRLGEELRDSGMALAADAQEAMTPGFADLAYDVIVTIARRQGTVHVDDVLRYHLRPAHPNAWGAVWMRAIRDGVLERTGQIRACEQDSGKHKHNYPVYRSLLWQPKPAKPPVPEWAWP